MVAYITACICERRRAQKPICLLGFSVCVLPVGLVKDVSPSKFCLAQNI